MACLAWYCRSGRFSGFTTEALDAKNKNRRICVIQTLTNEWKEAGIQEGDVLLVHSNIKRTFKRYLKLGARLSPQDILESFLNAVGSSGTLLLPLFNFDFSNGVPFDINNTPSHMGALTEAGRTHPLAVRAGHPIYSFAVIGFEAERFKEINNFSRYISIHQLQIK